MKTDERTNAALTDQVAIAVGNQLRIAYAKFDSTASNSTFQQGWRLIDHLLFDLEQLDVTP